MPYASRIEELGILQTQIVCVAVMPRADFVAEVERLLDEGFQDFPTVGERVLPVAKTIDRFPLGTWIDETRGCGCLVGEYLVAADLIERSVAAKEETSIFSLVDALPDGGALWEFGNRIDERLRGRLREVEVEDEETGEPVPVADIDVILIEG